MNIGKLMHKDGSGETCLLSFPHEEEENRNDAKVEFGRYLGPHSFMRFFPHIATFHDRNSLPFSYLGDVLRPKQFLRHKYRTLKTQFSEEELLENTADLVHGKVFSLAKDLVFVSSFEESFYSIYLALERALQNTETPMLLVIFSPFVYCSHHYEVVNIRGESFVRMIIEQMEASGRKVHILLVGSQKRTIKPIEKDFLESKKKWVEIIDAENIDPQFVATFPEVLNERFGDYQKLVFFSCNAVSSMYFPGKSFVNSDSPLDNKMTLSLFRNFARIQGLRALTVHDYNPQIEDYTSGIFLSTVIFEFLSKKYSLF